MTTDPSAADPSASQTSRATPFSAAQQTLLNRMADLMIPASADGRMPAASTLDLYAEVERLSVHERAVFERGLSALAACAQTDHAGAFDQLADAPAMAVVEAMRARDPGFIQVFTLHTAGRYLKHPRVLPLIGMPARPHWPQGHDVAQGDWSLIDVVRRRPKIYREV